MLSVLLSINVIVICAILICGGFYILFIMPERRCPECGARELGVNHPTDGMQTCRHCGYTRIAP